MFVHVGSWDQEGGGGRREGGREGGGREGEREGEKTARRWHKPGQRLKNVEHGL